MWSILSCNWFANYINVSTWFNVIQNDQQRFFRNKFKRTILCNWITRTCHYYRFSVCFLIYFRLDENDILIHFLSLWISARFNSSLISKWESYRSNSYLSRGYRFIDAQSPPERAMPFISILRDSFLTNQPESWGPSSSSFKGPLFQPKNFNFREPKKSMKKDQKRDHSIPRKHEWETWIHNHTIVRNSFPILCISIFRQPETVLISMFPGGRKKVEEVRDK